MVDPLFLTKNALLEKKKNTEQREDVVQVVPPHPRDPFPQGTLRDRPAQGLSPKPRAAQTAAPPELLPSQSYRCLEGFQDTK